LLLCLALLLPQAALAAGSKKASDGEIRVLLTRLNLKTEAWMTLEGRYLARGANGTEVLLPAGAQITVFLRTGQLALFHDGLSLNAGTALQLLRRQDGDIEPGIRFNLYAGVYPGDLTLSVQDGAIRPILTLPVESYLLGVVPYEMSDSFPKEALKSQAVCARTYVLSKMNPSAEWDVVDNTNDQVFRGVPDNSENTALAVQETEGLVLTWNDKLITAWDSASNGGQTELPGNVWSGDNIPGCFAMTDDPWDAKNPESTVRTASLAKDGTGLSAGFLKQIRSALAKQPELDDFRLTEDDPFRVDAIRAVQLTTPRYKEPSRLMTKLELTVSVSAVLKEGRTRPADSDPELDISDLLDAEHTPAPDSSAPESAQDPGLIPAGTFTVTLDLFPDTVFLLGLSVYGADNEIIAVTEEEGSFTLTAGRFGHGVGLSQRGAQYQASEGKKKYTEILGFYYPGAKLKRYTGQSAPLPTPDPVLGNTPGPIPTATPRPTLMPVTETLPEGAWLAVVENIDEDSSLNLREKPSAGSKVLRRLYKHQQLIVLEEAEVTGWVRVRTDVCEGYVMVSFLQQAE
ncbi:MAG: SpoIID/LytB domain-containing protein, partial [Clostridia bacterium]|nr:SpoIID/LytB domain-containing protein [Clostridia bacterium]